MHFVHVSHEPVIHMLVRALAALFLVGNIAVIIGADAFTSELPRAELGAEPGVSLLANHNQSRDILFLPDEVSAADTPPNARW